MSENGTHRNVPIANPTVSVSDKTTINVSFVFERGLEIRQANPDLVIFPPGSGLGVLDVVIEPLSLAGLDPVEARARIDRRIGDLALVSQAIALATVQFSAAVSS